MTHDLSYLIAKHFVARSSAKARQTANGGYVPVRDENDRTIPFTMEDIAAHLAGTATYGHYMLDGDATTKLFAYDIDLNDGSCPLHTRDNFPPCCQVGHDNWVAAADLSSAPPGVSTEQLDAWWAANSLVYPARPRENWRDRAHPGRGWWKHQMREIGELLASRIEYCLDIPAVVAYTGNKGIHVYGLTGRMPATDVREAALLVLGSLERFAPKAGSNFFYDTDPHWYYNFANFTVEVFPKQSEVREGGFGNLMRLPLGRNLKGRAGDGSYDPTFFVDTTAPATAGLAPVADPAGHLLSRLEKFGVAS